MLPAVQMAGPIGLKFFYGRPGCVKKSIFFFKVFSLTNCFFPRATRGPSAGVLYNIKHIE